MGPEAPGVSATPPAGATCSQQGCHQPAVVGCHYVDPGGRVCGTTWCEEHRPEVGPVSYCRRHARIMAAQGTGQLTGPLPGVDSRSASLLAYLTETIGTPVTRIMEVIARRLGAAVETAGITMLSRPQQRWEQAWAIRGTKEVLRVTLAVDEESDPEMLVSVNDLELQFVPPWIVRRNEGTELPPHEDAFERRQFYAELVENIRDAIESEIAHLSGDDW